MLIAVAKEEMLALREERGWTYGRIALKYGVCAGTVAYHCLIAGVEKPGKAFPKCYVRPGAIEQRAGHVVRRFTAEEDAMLLEQSLSGLRPGRIGRLCSPPRASNTIKARLATLARRDARAEAA